MEFNRMDMQSTIANTENAVQQNLSLGNRSVLKEIYTTNDGGAQLNPLAVKTTPRPSSMEQQKALAVAAMRSTSQPGTPTANMSCDPLRFTGLPEFDETQIPELAPLSGDMEAQSQADTSQLAHGYNSDSDVYAECLSMESGKMPADHSELESYSSALNDVLEQQLSRNVSTATTLENTLSEADAALSTANAATSDHNDSCEPMDVDEISETMEMLKEVLGPEDHQMLQRQFLGGSIEVVKAQTSPSKLLEPLQNAEPFALLQSPKVSAPAAQITSPPIPTHRPKTVEELNALMAMEQFDKFDLPEDEQAETKPAVQEEKIENQKEQSVEQEKVEQLEEPPVEQSEDQSTQQEVEKESIKEVQPDSSLKEVNTSEADQPNPPIEQAEDQHKELPALELGMCDSPKSAPSSPMFPIKHPEAEAPSHFPHSPHAPPEHDEMVYLEEAVIEPSSDRKLSLSGVIAREPLPIQVTVTEPSPEKPQEQPQALNETLPISNGSPLDGTFDHASAEPIELPADSATAAAAAAFGVPLENTMGEQQRRTFSMNLTSEEDQHQQIGDEFPMDSTYAMPLNAAKDEQRRTFSLADQTEQEKTTQRRTFHLEQAHMRRTFSAEPNTSPAMEATEENVMSDEPMDVDLSLRVDSAVPSQFTPSSPPIPTHQSNARAEFPSPPIPTHQSHERAEPASPPIPTHQSNFRQTKPSSPPILTHQPKEQHEDQSPEQHRDTHSPPLPTHQPKTELGMRDPATLLGETHSPPIPTLQEQLKRPSIHGDRLCPNATVVLEEQTLSAKEQLRVSDEKDDVLVEHFGAMSPITDEIFKSPQLTSSAFNNLAKEKAMGAAGAKASNGEQFQSGDIILNSSDFDYLFTKGHNNAPIDRSSLLLKFDPLLGTPVPVNQQQEQKLLNVLSNSNNNNNNNNLPRALSPTLEEHETSGSNQSFVLESSAKGRTPAGGLVDNDFKFKPPVDRTKKHAKMSVDVMDNDCNKTFDNSNLNLEDKTHKYHNMDELEKKIKNEVTRSEDIEKKLKEAEQREEALVKRITEKDKTNSKLNGVIEAYEKAIAELIHDKEQLVQDHEREMLEVQADRDSNYHHLTSLETTFSDLHVKYEKSKEMTSQLKKNEEILQDEKRKLMDKLRQQEQRYEQMRSHAMQQMEIANKKLATLTKDHADEVKKLKALLKKEEVSRISTAEQLQQKSRENADLLKICEDLIYDKGQGGSS